MIDNFEFEIERYIYIGANSETWVDVPLLTYALRNYTEYSPFLLGESLPGDIIHEAKQESWINNQISIFDL